MSKLSLSWSAFFSVQATKLADLGHAAAAAAAIHWGSFLLVLGVFSFVLGAFHDFSLKFQNKVGMSLHSFLILFFFFSTHNVNQPFIFWFFFKIIFDCWTFWFWFWFLLLQAFLYPHFKSFSTPHPINKFCQKTKQKKSQVFFHKFV